MKNTNTNPHAGIDYIMPGEEDDCGIEEVTEIEVHPLLDLMSKHLEEMERACSDEYSTSEATLHCTLLKLQDESSKLLNKN